MLRPIKAARAYKRMAGISSVLAGTSKRDPTGLARSSLEENHHEPHSCLRRAWLCR
jgi:hypothetical protein